jgi:hypothetical protein
MRVFCNPWWIVFGSVIGLMANGGPNNTLAFFVSRDFGLKSYGKIFGTMFGIVASSTAVGPFVFGLVFLPLAAEIPA